MIRHIVFVRFPADVADATTAALFGELNALRDVVAGMQSFAAGPDVSPEGLGQGFTHAFVADFDDEAARDAYLVHPAHKAAGGRLVAALDGGLGGLAVLDIALPDA